MSRPQLVEVRAPGSYIFYLFVVDSHSQHAYGCNKMRRSFPEEPQSHDVCVCVLMKECIMDFEFTLGERECVGCGVGEGVISPYFAVEIFWLDGFVNFHHLLIFPSSGKYL